jgi:lauroyl/myristoyl acyltransferase
VSVRWLEGYYQVSFEELNLTDVENAQTLPSRLNSLVEAVVQQHPEQYFWFHKKFKYFQQAQSG